MLGRRRTAIFILLFLIGALIPLMQQPIVVGEEIKLLGLINHSPIWITSEVGFTGSYVTAGDGSAGNPYIIENLSIDATSKDGIWIHNTRSHFILRNCLIYSPGSWSRGIYLKNTTNGILINNTLDRNRAGIEISSCKNITLFSNKFTGNVENLDVSGSSREHYNLTIPTNNTINGKPIIYWENKADLTVPSNPGYVGLVNCTNVTLKDQMLRDNEQGVLLAYTNNSKIYNNTIIENGWGIYIYKSNFNLIYNNTFNDSSTGLYSFRTNNNSIFNNTMHDIYSYGIHIYTSHFNIIYNNNISNITNYAAINIRNSNYNSVFQNTITNASNAGIRLEYNKIIDSSKNNTIFNNRISDGELGLMIEKNSENNTFSNHTISNCSNYGIWVYRAVLNIILNNTITQTRGMYIQEAENITLNNNVLSNNTYNFGIIGIDINDYNHSIAQNNTVNGKPIYYWINESNRIIPSDAGYVGLIKCKNIIVDNLTLLNNYQGILLYSTLNTTISNNSFNNINQACKIYDANNISIYNNIYNNSYYGIFIDKCIYGTLSGNIMNSTYTGFFLSYINRSRVFNNEFCNSSLFLSIHHSGFNDFYNNSIFNCKIGGIVASNSNNNLIFNNKINSTSNDGIFLYSNSGSNNIFNNTISNNIENGIDIKGYSIGNKIENNRIFGNGRHGISIGNAPNTVIFNNSIHLNGLDGILLDGYGNVVVKNNTFNNNLNGGIEIFGSNNNIFYDNTINNSINGIFIYNSKYNLISNNTVIAKKYGIRLNYNCLYNKLNRNLIINNTNGICLSVGSEWNTLESNNLDQNYYGIYLDKVSNNILQSNRISNSTKSGLYLFYSNQNKLYSNSLLNNKYNFGIEGKTIDDYDLTITNNNTINGKPIFYWQNQSDKTVPTNGGYVGLINCSNITVSNLNLTNNHQQILLYRSSNCTLENNTMIDQFSGVLLHLSENNTIKNNTAWNGPGMDGMNHYGIWINKKCNNTSVSNNTVHDNAYGIVVSGYGLTLINNTCYNNPFGIHIGGVTNSIIQNNIIRNSSDTGLSIGNSEYNYFIGNSIFESDYGIVSRAINNVYYNNLIYNNSNGIVFFSPYGYNLFYNNYFNNTQNYYLGFQSTWNITKKAGLNIIDGPYLGGNYWSDYTGSDTNSDGLGDTNLPYGPGDYLPLVKWVDTIPPTIADKTKGNPTTGDPFVLKVNAIDMGGIDGVFSEFWFDQGTHSNNTMNLTSGSITNGVYSSNTTVPLSAKNLHYFFSAKDKSGNWNRLKNTTIIVRDNDPPNVIDNSSSSLSTGEKFTFKATASDNIDVQTVHVEYWFDTGASNNVTMIDQGTFYNLTITVASDAKIMYYIFSAVDTSSNWFGLASKMLDIKDNVGPEIIDRTGSPRTGDDFTFDFQINENIDISVVYLEYWFDSDAVTNVTLPISYQYTIQAPPDAFKLYAKVTAIDTSDNLASLELQRNVLDNDKPVITDLTTADPETGEAFTISCDVTENRELERVWASYWFNHDEPINKTMLFLNNEYFIKINIPNDARELKYILHADDGINTIDMEENANVKDIIKPTVTDLSTGQPETMGVFVVNISSSDNIEVGYKYIDYWFDDSNPKSLAIGDFFNIQVPWKAQKLFYKITVYDWVDNSVNISKELIVLDTIKPEITDHSSKPTTGDLYVFDLFIQENIELESVYIEYRIDNDPYTKFLYQEHDSIIIPASARQLSYMIYAIDASGNIATFEEELEVKDNDDPEIEDFYQHLPTTGDEFELFIEVKDNILLSKAKIEYWFDLASDSGIKNLKDGNNSITIEIPRRTTELFYKVTATDESGYSKTLKNNIAILDNDAPEIIDKSELNVDTIEFKVDVTDNLEVTRVWVEFVIDSEEIQTEILRMNVENYERGVTMPNDAEIVYYTIWAEDGVGNQQSTNNMTIDLKEDQDKKPEKPEKEEDNTGLLIALIMIPVIIIILVLLLFLFLRKKKGGGQLPEIQKEEKKNVLPSTQIPIQQTPPQQLPVQNSFLNYKVQDQDQDQIRKY